MLNALDIMHKTLSLMRDGAVQQAADFLMASIDEYRRTEAAGQMPDDLAVMTRGVEVILCDIAAELINLHGSPPVLGKLLVELIRARQLLNEAA